MRAMPANQKLGENGYKSCGGEAKQVDQCHSVHLSHTLLQAHACTV